MSLIYFLKRKNRLNYGQEITVKSQNDVKSGCFYMLYVMASTTDRPMPYIRPFLILLKSSLYGSLVL